MKQDYRNPFEDSHKYCEVVTKPVEYKSGRQKRNERRQKQNKIKTPRY